MQFKRLSNGIAVTHRENMLKIIRLQETLSFGFSHHEHDFAYWAQKAQAK